jgi:hypothetical protein
MKTLLAAAAAALVVCLATSIPARASIEFAAQNDLVILHDGPGNNGGIFYVDVVGSSSSPLIGGYDFPTFCVEITEHISLGSQYKVNTISNTTVLTGKTLGSFAAWLYTEFLKPYQGLGAGISGLSGWVSDNAHANAVQSLIWKSMGWTPTQIAGAMVTTPDAAFITVLENAYAGDLLWTNGASPDAYGNRGTYTGKIAIMNLIGPYPGSTANAQDQLVYDDTIHGPPPPGAVPEPISVVVWSLLAVCVGGSILGRQRSA